MQGKLSDADRANLDSKAMAPTIDRVLPNKNFKEEDDPYWYFKELVRLVPLRLMEQLISNARKLDQYF